MESLAQVLLCATLGPMTAFSMVVVMLTAWVYQDLYKGKTVLMNGSSRQIMSFAIPAAFVVLVAVVAGSSYVFGKQEQEDWVSGALASVTGVISWCVTSFTFAFSCKSASLGGPDDRLKVLDAFLILQFVVTTVYCILLHLALASFVA